MAYKVYFHEDGRRFVWYPGNMRVELPDGGGIVSEGCSHLDMARQKARSYVARMRALRDA